MVREEIILKHIEGKDVLDIGSVGQTDAYNLFSLYKDADYSSLTGIDLEEAEKTVEELFGLKMDAERPVEIVTGNMETYSFNRDFDVIVAGDVLEHVGNQGLFLQNIRKHLRPDGVLILTTPNAASFSVLLPPNPTHTLWHDKYTLRRILEMSGLEITMERYYPGNKRHYPFYLRPLVFRQGLIVIAKRK